MTKKRGKSPKLVDEFAWLKGPKLEFPADVVRIRNCLEGLGYQVSLSQAEALWRAYSFTTLQGSSETVAGVCWYPLPETFSELLSKLENNVIPILKEK